MAAERSGLTRRRALQLGAGVAFSAPTIVSLASTPAYACAGSGGNSTGENPLVIDDFTVAQSGNSTISDGSFLFDERTTFDSTDGRYSSITPPLLDINKPASSGAPHPAPPDLSYSGNGPDLTGYSFLRLMGVLLPVTFPRLIINGCDGGQDIQGTSIGNYIDFDLNGVSLGTRQAPQLLRLLPSNHGTAGASRIYALGPLIALL